MTASVAALQNSARAASVAAGLHIGKHILNTLTAWAAAASDRSRFAALPARYLDDVGMTEAERVAALGYGEGTVDGWQVVASHL